MLAESVRKARRELAFTRQLLEKGWYHSFLLPDGARIDGVKSLSSLQQTYSQFLLPVDLGGKRVLDIGAWDGWFSFEAERRGAAVTAIDCVEIANFLYLRDKLASRVDYRILDVYELPAAGLGQFDYVFFLAVLYHLKHPLLALEIVCSLTKEVAIVESFVVDAATAAGARDEMPWMEFYETDELGGQLDNWFGPSVSCLLALCRAAGFARVQLLGVYEQHACVACYRAWEPVPLDPAQAAPVLMGAAHTRNYGVNFYTSRDEYLTCLFRTPEKNLSRETIRLWVGGFGVPAMYLKAVETDVWHLNARLPPGLTPGWKDVRVRTENSDFSNSVRIAVDIPPKTDALAVGSVCDGTTWKSNEVKRAGGGFLSFWIKGLAENCDRNNVRVRLGRTSLAVEFIGQPDEKGFRQLNVRVPASVPQGEHPFVVSFGEASAGPVPVHVL